MYKSFPVYVLPSVSSCLSVSRTALACSLCSKIWMRRCLGKVPFAVKFCHIWPAPSHSPSCLAHVASKISLGDRPCTHMLEIALSMCSLVSALASPSPKLPWPAHYLPGSGCVVAWAKSRSRIAAVKCSQTWPIIDHPSCCPASARRTYSLFRHCPY